MEDSATGYLKSPVHTTVPGEMKAVDFQWRRPRNMRRFHEERETSDRCRELHTGFNWIALQRTGSSQPNPLRLEFLPDPIHLQGEIFVLMHFGLHAADRMDHGGVIAAPE